MPRPETRPRRRPPRSTLVVRWLAVGALALVALLYYRPLRAYVDTRHDVARRTGEVRALRTANRVLDRRVSAATAGAAVARQARRLGYVKPGERPYVVEDLPK
jgi:cell division protein FtsB